MAYEGSVELISGIKQANNGTFPLVDASAVRVTDSERLDSSLGKKADKASPVFTGSVSMGRQGDTLPGAGSLVAGIGLIAKGKNQNVTGKYNVDDYYKAYVSGTTYYPGEIVVKVKDTIDPTSHVHVYSTYVYECLVENSDVVSTTAELPAAHWKTLNIYGGNVSVLNLPINSSFAEIVGTGVSDSSRANARALDWNGNEYLKGDLYINCDADSTNGAKVIPLPSVSASDNGSILCVINGEWAMIPGALLNHEKTISFEMPQTSLDPEESKSIVHLDTDIPDCMVKSTVALKTASFSGLPSDVVGEVTSISYTDYGVSCSVKLTNQSASAYTQVTSSASVSLTYTYYSF